MKKFLSDKKQNCNYLYTEELGMNRLKHRCVLLMSLFMAWTILSSGIVSAEEASEAQAPPEIVIDAPPPTQSPVKKETGSIETSESVTVYERKVLPGFRPCTTEDYQNADGDIVACENSEEARVISTRDNTNNNEDLIVEDDAVPQGNIFKLKFERFKKNKTK